MVPLEMLGYYTLASSIQWLAMLGGPIFCAVPSFFGIGSERGPPQTAGDVSSWSQLMAVVVLPVAIILVVFSQDGHPVVDG